MKKKLTKSERLAWYKKSLSAVKKNVHTGMCEALWDFSTNNEKLKMNFPELFRHIPKKPRKYSGYWFPLTMIGQKKRIKILQSCINETSPK